MRPSTFAARIFPNFVSRTSGTDNLAALTNLVTQDCPAKVEPLVTHVSNRNTRSFQFGNNLNNLETPFS
jgi:hypothetical protein